MRDTLKLVRGAVSTKDLLPVLTHFHIYDGRVQGGDGRLSIDAPCLELAGMECTVPAERFLRAVDACDGEPKLKLTDGGKLSVSRGKFRALLPLAAQDSFPRADMDKDGGLSIDWALLPVLRQLQPLIGTDASRPWFCGILFRDGHAWACNNVAVARMRGPISEEWLLPVWAIDELLRIGQEPQAIKLRENYIGLHFEGGWWMKIQKLHGQWPDMADLMQKNPPGELVAAAPLAEAARKVLPFCPDQKVPVIRTGPEGVSTLEGEMSATMGQAGLPVSAFRAEVLLPVLDAAKHISLSTYPAACYWKGDGVDGLIMGVRL